MLRLPSRRGVYLFPPSLLILCQSFATSLNAQPSFMSFDGADSIKYSEENPVSPPDEDHATSRYLQLPRAEQIGATIFADSEMDNFGQLMAVSADGRFIAIGALLHSEYMNGTGIVRVMENQNNSWKRIGNDIATEGDGVSAVAISCDGSTIAYHSPRGGRSEQLVAPVYKLGDAWNRVGEIIPGSSSLLSSYDAATALSLSGDGTVVALGWFGYTDPSEVRIYKWINDVWQEMESIQAHWKNDVISNVALSEDGSVVAVGVPFGHRFGDYIMVLQWDGGGWIQLGNDIQLGNHLPGRVVPMDISSGGSILAVGGSTIDPQSVHIFELRNGDWQQLGQDITGKVSNDSFGYSVSISGDGSVVAIGAPDYSPDMYQSVGYVRVFRFDGRRWQQIYYDIDGEGPSDYFGTTVSMSKDGSTVAVGSRAIRFVRDDYKYGLIKVYNLGVSTLVGAERFFVIIFRIVSSIASRLHCHRHMFAFLVSATQAL
eukprot:scaffold2047_cov129-Cylindrotheca_fusiformis.AAC.47